MNIHELWLKYRSPRLVSRITYTPYYKVINELNEISDYKNRKKITTLENTASIRWAQKELLIEKKGGKCIKCGCSNPMLLEFHHPEKNKERTIGSLLQGNWKRLFKESEKCIILCCNCHQLEHVDLLRIQEMRLLIDARKQRFNDFGYI